MEARTRGHARRVALGMAALALALAFAFASAVSAHSSASMKSNSRRAQLSCLSTHWIGAWESSPTDASTGHTIADRVDPSGNPKPSVDDETIRAVLTPSYGGSKVRVHLSNRFATTPVAFGHATIALKGGGAALAGTAVRITFGGQSAVTVPAGGEVVSDPVHFRFAAMQTLAVSMYVANDPGKPSEHYTARQTSYLSPADSGDHAGQRSGRAFTQTTTTRPYLEGLDVVAPALAGAVVAFGDSITDGYQRQAGGDHEATSTLDKNGRWPDDLARRLLAAHIPLSVLNAGISGNRVLVDGSAGGGYDTYGPAALKRVQQDVIDQAGVTTVVWQEGINDLGAKPTATVPELEASWRQGIAQMKAAGLHVLMGTLTPAEGAKGAYGTTATNRARLELNTWIRTKSQADGVINFDAAVRDPADPSRIEPAYDDGDHLHFNLAGYRAMAAAVKLSLLRGAVCRPAALRLTIRPGRIHAGRLTRVVFRVTSRARGHREPVADAVIRIRRHRLRTNRHGVASARLRFTRPERIRATVSASGYRTARAALRVVRARR